MYAVASRLRPMAFARMHGAFMHDTSVACAAEAAFAAFGGVQFFHLVKFHGEVGHDHQLGNTVAMGDGAHIVGIVVQRDDVLAPVVAVGHAHAVGGAQALLGGKAAAGKDGAEIPIRHGDGKTGADLHRGVGFDGNAALGQAGVQIVTGGLYTAVYPGQMVVNFNDWCFAEGRKAGDTGIVESEYGYHVMYYSGDSETMFRTFLIENALASAEYTEWTTALVEATAVTEKNMKYISTDLVLAN